MSNEMFTQLPTVSSAQLTDIICAVQSDISVQETLSQVSSLMLSNTVLSYAGNPNGNVAGQVYQLCWNTANNLLYVCTTTGSAAIAVWTVVASLVGPTVSINVPSSSAVPITNNTNTDMASILITPGKWSISGNINITAGSMAILTAYAWLNTVSVTVPDPSYVTALQNTVSSFQVIALTVPNQIITVGVNTNIYLSSVIGLSTGTATMTGNIIAQQIG
jgi:hypothetical protein